MTRAPDTLVIPNVGSPWVLAMLKGQVVRVPPGYHGVRIGRTITVQRMRIKRDGTLKMDGDE